MVAVIKTGQSVRRIFHYNENKVSIGDAICIGQGNYPADHNQLSPSFKINLLLRQLELNENVKRGSVHISLNFHPSEKDLNPQKLMQIASTYMTGIGFGEQPYLVYQHYDAAHPHIHIVSVKVKTDGKRIDMQNIGRNQSEAARLKIEKDFNLIKAQGREKQINYSLEPISVSKIKYGKIQSKKAISQVLDFVLSTYQYKSLPQLNAVLNLYNVTADRGSENSRVFKAGGLVYRILDKDGKPTGVPIKASDFYNKPTLKFLEERFKDNAAAVHNCKNRIKNAIDMAFLKSPIYSFGLLIKELEKQGINTVLRQNDAGRIYGVTYVDHIKRSVFNGSDLGKNYSAQSIQERCELYNQSAAHSQQLTSKNIWDIAENKAYTSQTPMVEKILENLLSSKLPSDYMPYHPSKKKRKKRKRKL